MNNELAKYNVYLFDLDGTVYSGSRPIESSITYIKLLIKQNKQVVFVTNNATVTAEYVKIKLEQFGLTLDTLHFVSSGVVTAFVLKKEAIQKAYIIGAEALIGYCKEQGIMHTDNEPEAVVVGLNPSLTYEHVAKAAELLQTKRIPFFATNTDMRLPKDNHFLPGAGTIVQMVVQAAQQQPFIIGKPHHSMVDYIAELFPMYDKTEWLMIGDNYETDILFGINHGIDTCFVETGVHNETYVKKQKQQPTYVYKHL